MKKVVSFALLGSTFAFMLFLAPRAHATKKSKLRWDYVEGQILVKMREGAVQGIEREYLSDQLLPIHTRPELVSSEEQSGPYLVQIDSSLSVEEAVAIAESDPRVEYAEPNYICHPLEMVPNDALFSLEWGLLNTGTDGLGGKAGADISATRAWDITTGSDDVVAAVVDTGTDLGHEDLSANRWINPREIPNNGVDDDGDGLVDDVSGWNFFANNNVLVESASVDNHGTHVAGTIGAAGNNGAGITGVAWHVKLMSVKFIARQSDGQVNGSTSDAIRAINFVSDQRRRGVNVRAINASWSGGKSKALHQAIVDAGAAGIVFVCAAGNGGDDGIGDNIDDPEAAEYPAAWADIPSLISVAALDRSDGLAGFSNFGHATVGVGAPGVSIISTFPGTASLPNGTYAQLSGTSMATPHVTGIVALLAAVNSSLTAEQIVARIVRTAEPILSLSSKVASSGRANAYNAVTNTTAQRGSPAISAISATKKLLTVDGLGFINGSAVIEANGSSLPADVKYDASFALANGSTSELSVKLGKPLMNSLFPIGTPVNVTVFNPTTGERSSAITFVRR